MRLLEQETNENNCVSRLVEGGVNAWEKATCGISPAELRGHARALRGRSPQKWSSNWEFVFDSSWARQLQGPHPERLLGGCDPLIWLTPASACRADRRIQAPVLRHVRAWSARQPLMSLKALTSTRLRDNLIVLSADPTSHLISLFLPLALFEAEIWQEFGARTGRKIWGSDCSLDKNLKMYLFSNGN